MNKNTSINPQSLGSVANDKVVEYLLGGNKNLIGTVIAIRKSLMKTNFDDYTKGSQENPNSKHFIPEGYAILLYFDHRLARIVRHIFNPNLVFWMKQPNFQLSYQIYRKDYS